MGLMLIANNFHTILFGTPEDKALFKSIILT